MTSISTLPLKECTARESKSGRVPLMFPGRRDVEFLPFLVPGDLDVDVVVVGDDLEVDAGLVAIVGERVEDHVTPDAGAAVMRAGWALAVAAAGVDGLEKGEATVRVEVDGEEGVGLAVLAGDALLVGRPPDVAPRGGLEEVGLV
jgi:hypothetical protein